MSRARTMRDSATTFFTVRPLAIATFTAVLLFGEVPLVHAQADAEEEREAMVQRYQNIRSYIKGGTVQPHWMADGNSFWYAEGEPDSTVIYSVDPVANTKSALFDVERLRSVLAAELGSEPPGKGVPFASFRFLDDSEQAIRFSVGGEEFVLELDTYSLTRAPEEWAETRSRYRPQPIRDWYFGGWYQYEELSPDSSWFATIKNHNLWLRSPVGDSMMQLTSDGIEDYEWGLGIGYEWEASWSPDGQKLAVQKGDWRSVPKIPIVQWLDDPVTVDWVHYPTIGGEAPRIELYIVDVPSKSQLCVGDEFNEIDIIGWREDGSELLFVRWGRTAERIDLMAADPVTGAARIVLTDIEPGPVLMGITRWHFLEDGRRVLWLSERDGWRHVYLYDLDGTLIRRLTQGELEVYRIVTVDEERGWVYFTARGGHARPYDAHLYRVPIAGGDMEQLTRAPAQHDSRAAPYRIAFSPSKRFFLDTYSTVAKPPVVELRRADGGFLQTVSKANIDALEELGWIPPEEFVVKAADDTTDLYGVLWKPYDFDPDKKYPIIDVIYPGPQFYTHPDVFAAWFDSFATQAFVLAQLGYITLIVDGRGTTGRGRTFRHAVYRSIGRHEIPDHAATVRQLAATRSYVDAERVGIFGTSWGGYFVLRALFTAPDVFHVGIAGVPLVDLDTTAAQWLEVWTHMGLPQDNEAGYEFAANRPLAGNLTGNLLLIHGTSDISASSFPGAMKMIQALMEAGKPFDLIVGPEQAHSWSGPGATSALAAVRRYFQEHLKP